MLVPPIQHMVSDLWIPTHNALSLTVRQFILYYIIDLEYKIKKEKTLCTV